MPSATTTREDPYINSAEVCVGLKDSKYQVVYRGEYLHGFKPGGWVFFQKSKESGGGYWFGRTYADCFMLEFERPTSLREGIEYLLAMDSIKSGLDVFDDDFKLT